MATLFSLIGRKQVFLTTVVDIFATEFYLQLLLVDAKESSVSASSIVCALLFTITTFLLNSTIKTVGAEG